MSSDPTAYVEWIVKPGLGVITGILAKVAWDMVAGYFTQGGLRRALSDTAPSVCEVYDAAQIDGLAERLMRIEKRHKRALALHRNESVRDNLFAASGLLQLSRGAAADVLARRLDQTREIGERLRIAAVGMSSGQR
jgi:hypothetical protein